MDPVSIFPPGVEIVQLAGPLIIAYLIEWALFATLTVQLYLYYQAFPNDRPFTKSLVYIVYCIQLVDIIFSTLDAFTVFGYGFGDFAALTNIGFAWLTGPIITSIDSLIVQSFYAFRLHMLSKFRIIPALIVAASLGISVSGCITGVFNMEAANVAMLDTRRISIAGGVWLVGSASIDIIIAICMTYVLLINDTGFRQTHALISKLVRLTIETGSLTALVALTNVILFFAFPGTAYYITPGLIIAMVYANTIFAVLNARFYIVGGRSGYTSSTDLMSIPAHLRDTPTISQPGAIVFNRRVFSERETDAHMEMKTVPQSFGAGAAYV